MDFIFEYLHNYFLNYNYYHEGIALTFTATDQIGGDLTSTDFTAGMFIKVSGTKLNDGAYLIKSVSDSAITIDTDYSSILTEAEITSNIYWMDVPKSLREVIAEMITFDASNTGDNISQEKQGNRDITYSGEASTLNAYSSKLQPFRRMRW